MSIKRSVLYPGSYHVEDDRLWREAVISLVPGRGWIWGEELGPFDPVRTDGLAYATAWGCAAAFLASVRC